MAVVLEMFKCTQGGGGGVYYIIYILPPWCTKLTNYNEVM